MSDPFQAEAVVVVGRPLPRPPKDNPVLGLNAAQRRAWKVLVEVFGPGIEIVRR